MTDSMPRRFWTPGTTLPDFGGATHQIVDRALFTGQGHAGVLRSHSGIDDIHFSLVVWHVDQYGKPKIDWFGDDESEANARFLQLVINTFPEPVDLDRERTCGCGGTGVHGVDHDD